MFMIVMYIHFNIIIVTADIQCDTWDKAGHEWSKLLTPRWDNAKVHDHSYEYWWAFFILSDMCGITVHGYNYNAKADTAV